MVAQLLSLRRSGPGYVSSDGQLAEDDLFAAEQNALLVRDAEEYYQQMFRASERSWNLRDRHMAATLDALIDHLDRRHGHPAHARSSCGSTTPTSATPGHRDVGARANSMSVS